MGRKPKANADTAATASKQGKRGPNRDYAHGDLEPSRCAKCGSTERGPYTKRTEFPRAETPDGRPCTHVVIRWTHCAACGQHRIDRCFENRIVKAAG
jgi:NAD-dependent SIR2 family protein deacetylase